MECFIVYADEIEGRIDPSPYHPIRLNTIKKIKSSKFKLLPLREVVEFSKKIVTSKADDLIYIGLENIESDTGVFIPSEEEKESFGTALKFEKGDILFPKLRPYLNKVYLAEFDGVCSTEFHVLKPVKCEGMYLFAFLNSRLVVNQTSYLMTGNTLPRLQTEDIKKLLIPIPPIETQEKIIAKIKQAYKIKKSKETEAKQLLDSINDYVLSELGIKLPELKDQMTFVVYADEIEGRIDPLYYSSDVFQLLRKLKFEIKTIGEIAIYIKTGFPAGASLQSHNEQGIIQIRPTNINENNLLVFEKNVYIKPEIAEKKKSELLKKGEVLFNNTNSQELVGKTAYFDLDGDYFCSNHITRIKVNKDIILPEYLCILLNQYQRNKVFYKLCTNWNNQSGINIELLKTIKIPLPPLEIQNKIAEEVKRRMQKAEQLQKEAKEVLGKAKQEVEKMILEG